MISSSTDAVSEHIRLLTPDLVTLRQHLHQNPELSDCEEETSRLVAERLDRLGIRTRTGVGGFGVVADLGDDRSGPRLALRADMDALPILEENEFPYRSNNPGVMHACGHDGHTAILLGVADVLHRRQGELPGPVRLIFQPAEETVGGAARMCADGVMEGVAGVVALHGWLELPAGHVGVRSGPSMASADTFDITVVGRGARAACPHLAVDPIVIASRIVLSLQSLVSREIDPLEPAVVTVARINAGTAYNIIPATAAIAGTVRTLKASVRDQLERAIRRVAEGECAASGAAYELRYTRGVPPVVNDRALAELVADVATACVGADAVTDDLIPSMGAEDFAVYQAHAPGVMFRLGIGDGPSGHTSRFDFNDAAIPVGVEVMSRLCLQGLRPRSETEI